MKALALRSSSSKLKQKKKCETKLNSWFNTAGIYYPNKLNIEQTSSETTAHIKSKLIGGESILDLTGGFGVDSYYFSKQFQSVIHCEMDPKLAQIATHNFNVMGAKNITTHTKDGIEFLKSCSDTFDWLYVDPSRRDAQKHKKFLIDDCSPNVTTHQDLFFKHANNILIKLSPMLDISVGVLALKQVKSIYIVAIKNEVKELLFHQRKRL